MDNILLIELLQYVKKIDKKIDRLSIKAKKEQAVIDAIVKSKSDGDEDEDLWKYIRENYTS